MRVRQLFASRRSRIGVAVFLCFAAVGAFFALRWSLRPRWNVIFVTLDTTRSDRIGCYGYKPALTPVLDGLAERGVLFERAYAPIPLTLPSHSSMFTGLYPPEHGIRTNGKNSLSNDLPTLAEAFVKRGYETGAFIASFVLDSKFGLERGFQTYDDDLTGTTPADEALHRNREGKIVVDRALDWLAGRTERPFFCWVHLYDPHTPYQDHPGQFGKQFLGRPYDAEIAYVDVQVGRLVKFVETQKLSDRTLIVVVGDHGEGLDQHQERRHGQMLYNSTLQVPWIMSFPGKYPTGLKISTPISLADVYPTLIEGMFLTGATKISGRSVMPLIYGKNGASRPLYAETNEAFLESGWSAQRCLIHDEWKYIRSPRVELYDVITDPGETKNLATERKEQAQQMEQQLADLEGKLKVRRGDDVKLSPAELRNLKSLGYVGHTGNVDALSVNPKLHDVKDMVAHYNALEDARILLDAGKFDQAEQGLKGILAAVPDLEYAEMSLGDIYLRQVKYKEAADVYQRVLKRNPESALALCHLGDIAEAQQRFEEALVHYEKSLEWEPDSAKLHYNIGRIQVILRRDDEAVEHFDEALKLDPGYVFAHIEKGSALSRRGLVNSALEEYELALKYDANSIHAHMSAAALLDQLERPDQVIPHLEKVTQVAPDHFDAQLRLAALWMLQGNFDKAQSRLAIAKRLSPNDPRISAMQKTIRDRGGRSK